MTISKSIIFVHRSVGVIGCLMVGGFTAHFFLAKEYIWAGVYAALTLFVLYRFIKDLFNAKPNYGSYYSIVICFLWPSWHEYSNHKRDLHLQKYDTVYNKTRQSLGIPIIPVGWHTEYPSDRSVTWRGKDNAMGHEEKYIGLDSLYKIEFENDEYRFKDGNDTSRITIFFRYGRGRSKDSMFYWYHFADTTMTISRHHADSIFDAKKISKDY
jgi:hypothetical protein